jgi:pullulanase
MNQVYGAGLGVGMFNDRLRDSARGGNFDHATRSDQGWLSGLYLDPNQSPFNSDTPATAEEQRAQLINYTYNVRLGMAGGLRDYLLTGPDGKPIRGAGLAYRGAPGAGFAADPQESISYVSAHDNYSLWDQIAAKAPYGLDGRQPATATPKQRTEMQMLGIGTVLLGQGVPFLDAGIEILRSKSGDGDSYDSGDWVNALDWSYAHNGWGKGLPAAWRNDKEWDFWKPRLSDPHFTASRGEILAALAQTRRLLRLRQATPLLRLRSEAEIRSRVHFLAAEAGQDQNPGLIAMLVEDAPASLDPARKRLLVLLNPAPSRVDFSHTALKDKWKFFHIKGQPLLQTALNVPVGKDAVTVPPMAASLAQLGPGSVRIPARGLVVLQVDE